MSETPFDKQRAVGNWQHGGYLEEVQGNRVYMSIVFTWLLPQAYSKAVWHRSLGRTVYAGGPAVDLHPDYLSDVAHVGGVAPFLRKHNPLATRTTVGCIRSCPFCPVSQIEGGFHELKAWPIAPKVCDNNLTAASRPHFDRVIDSLWGVRGVDFNQGLDARLLTPYHAQRLAELDVKCVRLAWDHIDQEDAVRQAHQTLCAAGFSTWDIRIYVLIGWQDTPEDALYRLQTTWRDLRSWPGPMRYQPLDTWKRNSHVGDGWTHRELQRYMKYWSNLTHPSGIPFEEYGRR